MLATRMNIGCLICYHFKGKAQERKILEKFRCNISERFLCYNSDIDQIYTIISNYVYTYVLLSLSLISISLIPCLTQSNHLFLGRPLPLILVLLLLPTLIRLSGVGITCFSSCCDKDSAFIFTTGRLPDVNPP
jgi:hypothetical protein